ncbi:hypothetical protein NXH56_02025 [Bifidobacterium thermophilum]|nr:hypothetical protein [Bifidobacterium thermophilum]
MKVKYETPHCWQKRRRRGAFYASMSIVMPGLNSTVKRSAKTVIFVLGISEEAIVVGLHFALLVAVL